MEYKMKLTAEQEAILNGSKGETMAKVMQTMIRYGELFGADCMVPVTSQYNHLVTSFGLKALTPVYDLMNQLIEAGAVSGQKFSADPRPLDKNVPANLLQNFVFKKFMYSKQDFYEGQLDKLGLMDKNAFTCTCYMDEVGNKPNKGEVVTIEFDTLDVAYIKLDATTLTLEANPAAQYVLQIAELEANADNINYEDAQRRERDRRALLGACLHGHLFLPGDGQR